MGRAVIAIPALAAMILFAGCASTDWEARYLEKEQEARALQEQYESYAQTSAERDASTEVWAREFGKTQEQVVALAHEVKKLKDRPAPAPEANAAAGDPEYERLQAEYRRLKQRYDHVSITEDGNLEITLDSSVTFQSGSYALTKQGRRTLDEVARELQGEFAGHMVRVVGHTDNDPIKKSPFKDNWELGAERALEVIRYLTSRHGIDGSRLVGASRGETKPVAENSSTAGKQRNRRVEIVVVIPRRALDPSYGRIR